MNHLYCYVVFLLLQQAWVQTFINWNITLNNLFTFLAGGVFTVAFSSSLLLSSDELLPSFCVALELFTGITFAANYYFFSRPIGFFIQIVASSESSELLSYFLPLVQLRYTAIYNLEKNLLINNMFDYHHNFRFFTFWINCEICINYFGHIHLSHLLLKEFLQKIDLL